MKNMRNKLSMIVAIMLLASLGTQAQKRIKAININVELPQVGADIGDGTKVTSITTDAFGSENMLGEGKIECNGGGRYLQFDTDGNRETPNAGFVFESGRKYVLRIHLTNFTNILFNYKNNKEFTVDDSMVKATINGKKAKITLGSGRPLICEMLITLPGERNPIEANTKLSAADDKHAGYGYVDLALPSGTKWATCNVGAAKPEAYGNYYAYGETKTKPKYDRESFIGYGAYTYTNPYNIQSFEEEDNKYAISTAMRQRLKPEYDAARQNMGGEWQIPTRLQCKELRENCYAKYVKINGVKGTLYTSLKNGKSIFLPYAGHINGTVNANKGIFGDYMTANSTRITHMFNITWGSSYSCNTQTKEWLFMQYTYECNEDPDGADIPSDGYPIRAVWGGDAFRGDKAKVGKLPALTGKRASSPKEKKVKKKETDDSDSSDKTEKKNSKEKMKNLLNKGKGLFNLLK